MIILNNAKNKHFITFKWKPAKDYTEDGEIIYAKTGLYAFKGHYAEKRLIPKLFGDVIERDNNEVLIETVSQFPFKDNDILVDDIGKEFLIKDFTFNMDDNQTRFLKSAFASKKYFLRCEE